MAKLTVEQFDRPSVFLFFTALALLPLMLLILLGLTRAGLLSGGSAS